MKFVGLFPHTDFHMFDCSDALVNAIKWKAD